MTAPLPVVVRRWRWRIFSATWLSYAGFYFCRKPFYIAKATLGAELGWDAAMLGLMGSFYLVAYTVGQFLAAWAGTRWGARRLLLVGMAVSVGANMAFGWTNSWATFASFMVVNGLAQATGWSGNVGAMAPWFRRRERGTVMGMWATNFQVGGVAANAIAAWVLGAWGFRWSFMVGSGVLMLAWVYFLFNQRNRPEDAGLEPLEDPDEEVQPPSDGGIGWARPVVVNVLLVGVFYFFVKFIRYALWSWAPYMLHHHYGVDVAQAGYLATSFDVSGIFGVVALGWMSDRFFGGRRVQLSLYFIVAMAAACGLLYLIGPRSITLFAVGMGLVGFTLYGPDAVMTSAGAIDVGSPRGATMAAGIINGMGSVGAVVQELLLGRLLASGGILPVFVSLLVSSLMAVLCLTVILWRNSTGRADL